MSLRFLLISAGLISVTSAVGCGGGGNDVSVGNLVPVGGTLLVDGKPMDGVLVTFTPKISENNRGGVGTTDGTGAFTVTHLNQDKPGLPAGAYTIRYSRMRLSDGSAPPELKEGEEPDPANIQVETLPIHLTSPSVSLPAYEAQIPEGGNTKLELNISTQPTTAELGSG